LGGILGLLLVFLVAWGGQFLLDYLDIDFKILISIKDLIFSIGLSVLIGLISGFWPANVASKMNPVEAIRTK
jgi:putative ABC transport system permease protein